MKVDYSEVALSVRLSLRKIPLLPQIFLWPLCTLFLLEKGGKKKNNLCPGDRILGTLIPLQFSL